MHPAKSTPKKSNLHKTIELCMKLKIVCVSFLLMTGLAANLQAQTDTSAVKVLTHVEKPAEFRGGADGWRKYLEQNLTYPKKAMKKNIQGVVRVQFIVDKAGNVSEVMALNDPGGGIAEEAVRVIKEGPKWKPAEQDGKKVLYRHIQSITFAFQ